MQSIKLRRYEYRPFRNPSTEEQVKRINAAVACAATAKQWEDEQCDICGDYHDGDIPRECETGDGI